MKERGREIEKVSIEMCRKILEKHGYKYTDEEIKKIREFLYILAEIEFQHYLNTYEKGNPIC